MALEQSYAGVLPQETLLHTLHAQWHTLWAQPVLSVSSSSPASSESLSAPDSVATLTSLEELSCSSILSTSYSFAATSVGNEVSTRVGQQGNALEYLARAAMANALTSAHAVGLFDTSLLVQLASTEGREHAHLLASLPDAFATVCMGMTSTLPTSDGCARLTAQDAPRMQIHACLGDHIARIFTEQVSPIDWPVRIQWLEHVLAMLHRIEQHTGGVALPITVVIQRTVLVIRHWLSCPLMQSFMQRRAWLVQFVGWRLEQVQHEPVHLSLNESLWTLLQSAITSQAMTADAMEATQARTWLSTLDVCLERLLWFRMRIERDLAERVVVDRQVDKPKAAWSPLEEAMACHHGTLDKSRASHPFLALFYSWLVAMDSFVQQKYFMVLPEEGVNAHRIAQENQCLREWFSARDQCWKVVHGADPMSSAATDSKSFASGEAFDIDMVHVRWRALSKRTRELLALGAELVHEGGNDATSVSSSLLFALVHAKNVQEKLDHTLSAHSVVTKDTLWKHGGHPFMPRSSDLQLLQREFAQVDAQVEFNTTLSMVDASANAQVISTALLPVDGTVTTLLSAHPAVVVDTEWRRSLLEAECHIRVAHQLHLTESNASLTLITALRDVPNVLATRLAKLKQDRVTYSAQEYFQVKLQADEYASREFDESDSDEEEGPDRVLQITTLSKRDALWSHVVVPMWPLFDLSLARAEQAVLSGVASLLAGYRVLRVQHPSEASPTVTPTLVKPSLSRPAAFQASDVVHSAGVRAAMMHWVLLCDQMLPWLQRILAFALHRTSRTPKSLAAYQTLLWQLTPLRQELHAMLLHMNQLSQSHELIKANIMLLFQSQLNKWHELMIHDLPSLVQDLQHGAAKFTSNGMLMSAHAATQASEHELPRFATLSTRLAVYLSQMTGPSAMHVPLASSMLIYYVARAEHVPIQQRHLQQRQLRLLLQHVVQTEATLSSPAASTDTPTLSSDILQVASSLAFLLHCFVKSFATGPAGSSSVSVATFAPVSRLCAQLISALGGPAIVPPSATTAAQLHLQLPSAVAALSHCTDARLATMCTSLVTPMLRSLVALVTTAPTLSERVRLRERGMLWLRLGLLRTHLLAPSRPLDPTLKFLVRVNDAEDELCEIAWELQARRWVLSLTSGTQSDAATDRLEAQSQALSTKRDECHAHMTTRPTWVSAASGRKFSGLYEEVRHYITTVADVTKLLQLAEQLSVVEPPPSMHTLQEEKLFHENTHRFVVRLRQHFPAFADFVEPLVGAVLQMQFGLTVTAATSQPTFANSMGDAVQSLLGYPLCLSSPPPRVVTTTPTPLTLHTLLPSLATLVDVSLLRELETLSAQSPLRLFRSVRLSVLRTVLLRVERLAAASAGIVMGDTDVCVSG